ncbi:MAG: hypothetical protein JWN56_1330 [Sphingobacteriales bacterium]|nr:hypothetical protein [Sphingobacteriales bacterium]
MKSLTKAGVGLIAVLYLFLNFLPTAAQAQKLNKRDFLVRALQGKSVQSYLSGIKIWQIKQRADYKRGIAALPDSVKHKLLANADAALSYTWPFISASLYLDYKFTGNRYNFERIYEERRKILSQLVIGELIAGNKKYIPQIVNGLWAIMEESTWVLPAHIGFQKSQTGLPDPSEVIIDLGSGITAPIIAATQFMLHDELQSYSVVINKRIDSELQKRIIDPYLKRDDFGWMGFKGQEVNNWNTWINTNILHTVLLSSLNSDTTALVISKILKSTDNFINQYPADGGCDEGPSYWREAGGKLIRMLHLLTSVTDGKMTWKDNSLIHNIGSYIYKFHASDDYFVNFADAFPKSIPSPESVYQYGAMFNDDSLKQFSAYLFNKNNGKLENDNVADFLETVAIYDILISTPAIAPLPAFSWLPDREVLTARSKQGSIKGLFFAAQGGNNAESHNHNDIGNFILYVNGAPVIVDAGVGSYTSKTFSNERYNLWNMQSAWHNCPTINGVMQKDGQKYKATDLLFSRKKSELSLTMNIAGAYPAEAAVKSWKRNFRFNTSKNELLLTERYELTAWKDTTKINFLSYASVKELKKGVLTFYDKDQKPVLLMNYDSAIFNWGIETKTLDDERIKGAWGDVLYRITLTLSDKKRSGEYNIRFSMP